MKFFCLWGCFPLHEAEGTGTVVPALNIWLPLADALCRCPGFFFPGQGTIECPPAGSIHRVENLWDKPLEASRLCALGEAAQMGIQVPSHCSATAGSPWQLAEGSSPQSIPASGEIQRAGDT